MTKLIAKRMSVLLTSCLEAAKAVNPLMGPLLKLTVLFMAPI